MTNLLYFAAFVLVAFLLGRIQHQLAEDSRRPVRVRREDGRRHRAE